MKLLKITMTLNSNGISTKVKTIIDVIETPKTFKFGHRERLNKSKVMVADSIFRNTIFNGSPTIQYTTYCLVDDEMIAVKMLTKTILDRVAILGNGYQALLKSLVTEPKVTYV